MIRMLGLYNHYNAQTSIIRRTLLYIATTYMRHK